MKKQSIFHAVAFSVNVLLISSVLLVLFGLGWECSTRWYLSGFSNAVLPYTSSPEKKVAAILAWMEHGPARETEYYSDDAEDRDPIDTLNYKELLDVCGTATNAFVNLASAGGIEARRLLLLDAQGMNTNHVVAEVRMDGRWVIVDPSFHAILTDANGHFLTRQELARPGVLEDATRNLPVTILRTIINIRHSYILRAFPWWELLQAKLNSALPFWQARVNWTVLVERQSYDTLIAGIVLLCVALVLRRLVRWYGATLPVSPVGPWEQLTSGGIALFSPSPADKLERKNQTAWGVVPPGKGGNFV